MYYIKNNFRRSLLDFSDRLFLQQLLYVRIYIYELNHLEMSVYKYLFVCFYYYAYSFSAEYIYDIRAVVCLCRGFVGSNLPPRSEKNRSNVLISTGNTVCTHR